MPTYMIQGSYSTAAIAAMVKNPQDRAVAIRTVVEKLGGKLHGLWFTFGEYDIVAISEMPDSASAAAFSMAIGATGSMSAYRTTPLMTTQESVEAMKKAGGIGYQPPR